MIMRRLGKRTGTAQRRNGDTLRKPPHWQSGRAAGEADGVPAGAAKACPVHTKKGAPTSYDVRGSPRHGGDLLSQLVCQYHRRARA